MADLRKPIPSSFGPQNQNNLLLPARAYEYFQHGTDFPFTADVQGHSSIDAWWLAECSLLAYETPANIRSVLTSVARFDASTFVSLEDAASGLNGFCIRGQDFAVISFRGTEFYRPDDIFRDVSKLWSVGRDIAQDAKLFMSTSNGPPGFDVKVVKGFRQPLESIWPKLSSWIDGLPRSRNLWLTGHSLGGAMAVLAAYQVADRVAGVYTFGCPCPGGEAFAEKFNHLGLNQRTFRYVHGNDPVAKGLEFPFSQYRHVGILRAISADSRKNLAEQAVNAVFPLDMTDHAPLYYALHTWNEFLK